MKLSLKSLKAALLYLGKRLSGGRALKPLEIEEQPMILELFSADLRWRNGVNLAEFHKVKPGRSKNELLTRLNQNENLLIGVHSLLIDDINEGRRIAPAAEWLLDNFYVVEEHIRAAKRHLPKDYSRGLPHLANSLSAGLPRVYDIALETIAHCDGRVEADNLGHMLSAYQSVSVLKLGELWAIPIMLRLALIENIGRIASSMVSDRTGRALAWIWAEKMISTAAKEPHELVLAVADLARSQPDLTNAFVAEFSRRLKNQALLLALPLTWLEQRLAESGRNLEQIAQADNIAQAAQQASMSNCLGSLRALAAIDWQEFVESMSLVEKELLKDPASLYARMDFITRDRYRHAVENLAKGSLLTESELAAQAVGLASMAALKSEGDDNREAHVGFYLIGPGLPSLEKIASDHKSPASYLAATARRVPLKLYAWTMISLTALLIWHFFSMLPINLFKSWLIVFLIPLGILAASHLAVALTNWLATVVVKPEMLPRMDFSKGLPVACRTLVVVPAMLASDLGVKKLIKDMEVRFLANQDAAVHFALLTDFLDSKEESEKSDEPLLLLARESIEALNAKYSRGESDIFFWFHRPRLWNEDERLWMGYERKRGKLADINEFLRGGAQDKFSEIAGKAAILSGVKYVITLDADTILPRDCARQMAGAMAHPLNRPLYDENSRRIVDGYGILQPRISPDPAGEGQSPYARMCAGQMGIDPYTRAISDVYQDIFGEGSFIGKGIYEVDAFRQVTMNRFPDNRILSHDLLEGCYARSGLLMDVQLYEAPVSTYSADVGRRHRWVRGDWQIAGWALGYVPDSEGGASQNTLSRLSRWKILDNLRRSLAPAAITLLFVIGWLTLPSAGLWTLSVAGLILMPPIAFSAINACRKPADLSLGRHMLAQARRWPRCFALTLFELACLPFEAFFNLDAMFRSLWRLAVSHELRLQWAPFVDHDADNRPGLRRSYAEMAAGPFIALIAFLAIAAANEPGLYAAWPVLCLWLIAPTAAWLMGRPHVIPLKKLSADQVLFLRKMARKTWSFFETFVNEENHWLPPDNYQEHPVAKTAHRTSPTNMGLALLSNLSAYDLGAVSAGRCLNRIEKTIETMESLERYRGHFFNWYDTISLKPLAPLYVSSVDSGNLAGHLLVLAAGLREMTNHKIINADIWASLNDVVLIVLDIQAQNQNQAVTDKLVKIRNRLEAAMKTPINSLNGIRHSLRLLKSCMAEAEADQGGAADFNDNPIKFWMESFNTQCQDALDELKLLAPWLETLPQACGHKDHSEYDEVITLGDVIKLSAKSQKRLGRLSDEALADEELWLHHLTGFLAEGGQSASERLERIERLAVRCTALAEMEYDFLYDKNRRLLSIGYNVNEHRLDSSYYDLLASEARLAVFVGIAQNKLPRESWFALGRLLTTAAGEPILLSWSGSMFEYLMPLLIMPSYEHTLLGETCKTAIARQIEYGKARQVPWGISESGYNLFDAHQDYQYRAFGVPGLGLKRGLTEDLVISPYASALALMLAPREACLNLQRLSTENIEGRFGFYEAVDYTVSRLPRGETRAVVRSFMAHHQGMSLVAMLEAIGDKPMRTRFASLPLFQSARLLLQEKLPEAVTPYTHTAEHPEIRMTPDFSDLAIRTFRTPHSPVPQVQLLSNGRYHVMVTTAGGGYSRWLDMDVTRWREDPTLDNKGLFCYLKELNGDEFWSITHQPARKESKFDEIFFSEGRAEFNCRHQKFDIHTEIVVSPEDDVELRRIRLTNLGKTTRTIEATSFTEIVMAQGAADAMHPAFSNLFVQTEIIDGQRLIIARRRPRSENEQTPLMMHMMVVHGADMADFSYETDRQKFLGREGNPANPEAMRRSGGHLSGGQGSVLDPCAAIRSRITLKAGQSVIVDLVQGVGQDRDTILKLADKYRDRYIADRVFNMVWTNSQMFLRQINASEAEAQICNRLAGSIIHADNYFRAPSKVVAKNRRGQSGLWGYGISGDLPIVMVKVESVENLDLVRQVLKAHSYWRLKGLAVDLVVCNDDQGGYRQISHEQIQNLITASETGRPNGAGGIFLLDSGHLNAEDQLLFQAASRVIIRDSLGTLAEQVVRPVASEPAQPLFTAAKAALRHVANPKPPEPRNDLIFFNGVGGFTPDGREYVITTAYGQGSPAPWVNVLANPSFGTVVSENGLAYTFGENAHEFRLTPWGNDLAADFPGEAFYIRDEENGQVWSPAPGPCRGSSPYVTRHGFGYSVFEHMEQSVQTELTVYVDIAAPVKFIKIKIRNASDKVRKLSITGYVEWVLGDLKSKTAPQIVTEIDLKSQIFFARNSYNADFQNQTAFFDTDHPINGLTGDRAEFLGRNGSLKSPAALKRTGLSGKTGAGLDPCAALQTVFTLAPGQEREIIFRLGIGANADDARQLAHRFRGQAAARGSLEKVWHYWSHTLGAINVDTPDPSFNVLANGWLMYQTIACRLWGRSATYQSGGAFGFRDQLQDVMALVHAAPEMTRAHLLVSAARQFPEGDVQHWWHPPQGQGVRTRCSDDYLWLPLALCRYVSATGDTGILDEQAHFLESRELKSGESSHYDLPKRSEKAISLYEHSKLAIEHALYFGRHGLPYIGSGDWNDGMDLVGEKGLGESVWLGFFLCAVLNEFGKMAQKRGDTIFAGLCEKQAAKLTGNIEREAWDGQWYKRAYFDDGTPLGSSASSECRIDSIAQSWAVLSGAAGRKRAETAMRSLDEHLVRRDLGIIQLFSPPFDKSGLNPGYIKGYIPGVRENGGQYTHAAIWAAMAFAELGDHARAWELFNMINPVNHSKTAALAAVYKVEPYVMAADVYAAPPHAGRGGWTWYTGSAAWMYRLMIESLLGLKLENGRLSFAPCFPDGWNEFTVHYRYRETVYHIRVIKSSGEISESKVYLDGSEQQNQCISLVDDHIVHQAEVMVSRG